MFFSKKPKIKKIKEDLKNNKINSFKIEEIFPDQNLAQIIANSLKLTTNDKVTLDQLNSIETVNASNSNITNLEGLEFLNNLKTANFSNNSIIKLPDYTDSNPFLYKNKDTLILIDLSNNPFLDSNNLFSLDNSEARRKFIGQFEDAYTRFNLNPVKDKLFIDSEVNPGIIRLAINSLLPRSLDTDRDNQINDIFLKYIIGKKLFYNKDIYKNNYLVNNGKLNFRTNLITPSYLNNESESVISQLLEQILPQEDIYLLRSIIQNSKELVQLNTNNIEDYINYYQENPLDLSEDYIQDNSGWKEKSNYRDFKSATLSSEEELLLKSIANLVIRDEYNKYIQMKDVLKLYLNDHPDKTESVTKILNKNDNQIKDFLKQYLYLEKNEMLTEKQKETIKQAEQSIQTFNSSYRSQLTDLFEQDIFGLEVEMKYIDMLAEADKKIN